MLTHLRHATGLQALTLYNVDSITIKCAAPTTFSYVVWQATAAQLLSGARGNHGEQCKQAASRKDIVPMTM